MEVAKEYLSGNIKTIMKKIYISLILVINKIVLAIKGDLI